MNSALARRFRAPLWLAVLGVLFSLYRRFRRRRTASPTAVPCRAPAGLADAAASKVQEAGSPAAPRPLSLQDRAKALVEAALYQVRDFLLNQQNRLYLNAFGILMIGALAPQLLLSSCLARPSCRVFLVLLLTTCLLVTAGLLLVAEVLEAEKEKRAKRQGKVQDGSGAPVAPDLAALVDAWLDKAMSMADGTDGEWRDEGQEQTTRISSKDMGTRFPAFRGIVEISGEALSKEESPPTAEEVFAASVSFTGRQLSDPFRETDTILQRIGEHAWLSFQTWTGNYIQSPQSGLFLQAVRRTSTSSQLPRFTLVTVPAPAELAAAHAEAVQKIKQGRSLKDAPTLLSMVDVQGCPGGGLRVCNVIHADPNIPRLVPSTMVQGFIRSVPCRGAAFLDMALRLRLPQPLTPEGPREQVSPADLEEVSINGRVCEVSRLLSGILKDADHAKGGLASR